jgi:hypothetical protein
MLSGVLAGHDQNDTGYRAGVTSGSGAAGRVFRLPASAFIIVLFLFFGAIPLAFTASNFTFDEKGSAQGAPGVVGWQTTILLIPVLVGFFIGRTATFVDAEGLRIRALFGSRRFTWDRVRGLSLDGRNVYLVTDDGSYRLPCVHVVNLAALSRASGGHLPELAEPRLKVPPQRRRRR